jgi:putative PIN family toxin of toxin-antitoxin system
VRAVLDPNVLISAALSPSGVPARVLVAAHEGEFELVISPLLAEELDRALAYPKLRKRISADDATAFVEWLRRSATVISDPDEPSRTHSSDPGDDYLLALASSQGAALASGDKHLLDLADDLPIYSPAGFLALLEKQRQ